MRLLFTGLPEWGVVYVLFIKGLELIGTKWRTLVGGLFFVPYALAYMAVAGLAYLIPEWSTLNFVSSLSGVFMLIVYL